MSELLPPRAPVEYVVLRPPARKSQLLLVLMTSLILLLIGIAAVAYWLRNRNLALRTFPAVRLSASGLGGILRTKWDEGGHYVLHIRPLPGTESHFSDVLQLDPRPPMSFTVVLLDSDGFELCEGTPQLRPSTDADGKGKLLEGEGLFANCDKPHFRRAARWRMSYAFPKLADNLHPSPAEPTEAKHPVSASGNRDVPKSSASEATLTGSDFQSGDIETLSNGSYRITRSAEKMTVALWESPDKVRIECEGNECIVTDLRTGESVHARRK